MSFLVKCFFLLIVILNRPVYTHAQLCQGSLGDPAVNITFGSAGNPDISFTPPGAYTFIASSCPNDGYFTVVDATQGCFGNSWHTVSTDHTGGGAFMLVNASYEPGDFFRTSVNDLCPNTTYEFAAWAMNVLRGNGISPDLTFRIEKEDGTVLGEFSTGPIATSTTPLWQQYGFFFTTPADNPVVILRITNNAPGGIGNDLALDDITFRPCGPTVTAAITGITGDISVCEGDPGLFEFTADASSYYLTPVFQWQLSKDSGSTWTDIPGAITDTYRRMPTGKGHYWYRFAVSESGAPVKCRINSNELIIHVWPEPLADAGPDRVLISGDTVVLNARSDSGALYSWQPASYLSDPSVLQPLAFPPVSTTFRFSVISDHGCSNEDWVTIKVIDKVYIPTAFTPNNDGRNDQWRVPLLDPEWGASVKIYNRYGEIVYQGEGPAISWNGTKSGVAQSAGVYVYVLTIRQTGVTMKGTITLIR